MAFDYYDPEQRRQRRAAKKKEREREQRQLRNRLLLAGVVILVCGGLIFAVSQGWISLGEQEPSSISQTDPGATEGTTVPRQPETVIHIVAAGDVNVTDTTVNAGDAAGDFSHVFMDVLPLLADADLTCVNFEGNLVGPPYGAANSSAPQAMVQALAAAGVDVVQMANSRSITNGISGLATTIQAIRNAGMEAVGAYATPAEFRSSGGYLMRDIQGVRVAIVAFTKGMGGMALPEDNEDCVNVLYTDYDTEYQRIDRDGITRLLRNIAQEQPDITIALLHWGSEYNDTISDSQKAIQELMFQEGVDAIIGTHPHYVQQIVYDPEAGTVVAYSLGDLLSDATRAGTEYAVILDLEITKDNEYNQTRITGCTYTPISIVNDDSGGLRVLRMAEALYAYESRNVDRVSQQTYEDMVYAQQRVRERAEPTNPEDATDGEDETTAPGTTGGDTGTSGTTEGAGTTGDTGGTEDTGTTGDADATTGDTGQASTG